MKLKMLIILLIIFFQNLFSLSYQRDQVARYAYRYTRLTNGHSESVNSPPDSMWWNVNPFVYKLEGGSQNSNAGYISGADCAHFVSQCLQAGYIPMWENNFHDDVNRLGYGSAKNLNIFAVNHLTQSKNREDHNYCVFYPTNIYLEEDFEPPIESPHPYSDFMNIFKSLSSDIMKAKVYFDSLDLGRNHELDIQSLSLPDLNYHNWNNGGHFWSDFIGQYEENELTYLQFTLHVLYPLEGNYGFKISKIKWRGADEPKSSYHKGDFQIFCKYRASATYQNHSYEIHYENTYNDTGRMIWYKHAAICNYGSGANVTVCAHNTDRVNKNFHYYIPWNGSNSIIFYEVPDNSSLLKIPNLVPYNKWGNKAIITTIDSLSDNDVSRFPVGDIVYVKYAFKNTGSIMIPDRFQVRVEYQNLRTLVDSVLYNGILSNQIISDFVSFPMPDVDSLKITVKLDAGTNLDYGDDWQRTWNEQAWIESNEADNEFSKVIYKGLPQPTDVQIEINSDRGTLTIHWSGDSGLIYKVYSSNNPYSGFTEDHSGTFTGTSWTAPQPTENKFYYIIATDGRNTKKSKSIHYLRRK